MPYQLHCCPNGVLDATDEDDELGLLLELLEGAELFTEELVLATDELLGLDELLVVTDELTTLDATELLVLELPP